MVTPTTSLCVEPRSPLHSFASSSRLETPIQIRMDYRAPTSPSIALDTAPTSAEDQEARELRRELKRLADVNRPLDSWERYRALNDSLDEAYEQIDLGNREARFALILMGGLNAALIVLATGTDLPQSFSQAQRNWVFGLLLLYVVVAVRFLLQAIDALRPGKFRPQLGTWPSDSEDFPRGVRYYEDVIERDTEAHWRAWQEVRIGQLNAELAVQFHSLCQKNEHRHLAVRRLYAGLRLMTILLAGLAGMLVCFAWL
jgi:hypothetical protein